MDNKALQELSEVVQSSNLSFLFGAGSSLPFLPLLGNIEEELNKSTTDLQREVQLKRYLDEIMLPNKKVIAGDLDGNDNFKKTCDDYKNFFKVLIEVLIRRKNTILSKQANLFTTNIDVLIETCLEELKLEYNDGFTGKFSPIFSLANFKKSIYQRSLHFEHISEIPVLNLIKIHGSLTWKLDETTGKIIFSRSLDHFDVSLTKTTGDDFLRSYKKIQVINPEEA